MRNNEHLLLINALASMLAAWRRLEEKSARLAATRIVGGVKHIMRGKMKRNHEEPRSELNQRNRNERKPKEKAIASCIIGITARAYIVKVLLRGDISITQLILNIRVPRA